MARGNVAPEGTRNVSANGYHYIKKEGKWRLTHHVIAEELLNRIVDSKTERVIFVDGDRNNLDPTNIRVVAKNTSKSTTAKQARIRARIQDLQAELAELEHLEAQS
jgi:hypothetical protein